MIILGRDSEDKGNQLEALTKRLLELYGYTDVVVNQITSGGQEIDVSAGYYIEGPGEPRVVHLVVECKAQQAPVSMPDWLKFLGKLYSEEIRLRAEVHGLFVALSGVNGPVAGCYSEVREHNDGITILSGDSLLAELQKTHGIASRELVVEAIEAHTSRVYTSIEPVYYEESIRWLVMFPEGRYALLDGSGAPLGLEDTPPEVTDLIRNVTDTSGQLDLGEEKESLDRLLHLEKLLLATALSSGEQFSLEAVSGIDEYSAREIDTAVYNLKSRGWMAAENGNARLLLSDQDLPERFVNLTHLLTHLFETSIATDTFEIIYQGDFLTSHIADDLIDYISTVQEGLPFTPELRSLTKQIISYSPSALMFCLAPYPIVVTHRRKQPERTEYDDEDRMNFKRGLFVALSHDFHQPSFKRYFYEMHGLREIQRYERILVKSEDRVVVEEEVKTRDAIAPLHEDLGGGYGLVLLRENAPEPWEWPR